MVHENAGKIVEINVSSQQATIEHLDARIARKFLGGLGLGIKILYDEVGPSVEALSSDNVIIIAAGLLSGTMAPTCGRAQVVTKSPLTGILGTGNFGGWWGPRLKSAGFEAVVIRGASESPSYLWVNDSEVQLRSAKHLWGKDTWETTNALKEELGDDVSVLAIGQAGENLVKFACPIADYDHAAGRSHAGCVMGAKKLKAIAVRGTQEVTLARPQEFDLAVSEARDRIIHFPERGDRLRVGSHYVVKGAAESGALTVGNYQPKRLPSDSDIWHLPESAEQILTRQPGRYGYRCPMAPLYGCDMVAEVNTGSSAGRKLGGVSFSFTSIEWGGKCGIRNYADMWKCRELCQQYGMDQVTPIPFAMELFEKGIITREDLGGLELNWADEQAVFEMLGRIARREGLGDLLAEGNASAAAEIGKGAEQCTVALKGMAWLGADARASGMATKLGYMTNPRGGDDLLTSHSLKETFPAWARQAGWQEEEYFQWLVEYVDMFEDVKKQVFGSPPHIESIRQGTIAGKAAQTKWFGDLVAVYDSLGLCMFSGSYGAALGPTHYAKLYSAYTGWPTTPQELMKSGERIHNLMRLYITRAGITRQDDDLPERFYQEPRAGGAGQGAVASREETSRLLDAYYKLRGWDIQSGIPTRKKLAELGLDDVADK
jgi:aldehyde:ferredoxin oxidoreductase